MSATPGPTVDDVRVTRLPSRRFRPWPRRSPLETLGTLVSALTERDTAQEHGFAYWRALFGGNRWCVVLITRGKPGQPQNPPYAGRVPAPKLSPRWSRR